jgi:flagellar basal-body rod protein FlgC
MDYFVAMDISASGMTTQRFRLDTVSLNLANATTTRGIEGGPYRRQQVILGERAMRPSFEQLLERERGVRYAGVEVLQVQEDDSPPRLVLEPGHPDADARGFVRYPNIDPVGEMVILMEAMRLYEANVRALNAGKEMALRALQI